MSQALILLKQLLLKLSKSELTSLKKILTSSTIDLIQNKSIKLVKIVIDFPDLNGVEIQRRIYGAINNAAFTKLVERVIDRIDDMYISFTGDDVNSFSGRNYYYFSLKRKLLILQMRWMRGVDAGLQAQFDKIISVSKKYELYGWF